LSILDGDLMYLYNKNSNVYKSSNSKIKN
jgi:hypothetical protein